MFSSTINMLLQTLADLFGFYLILTSMQGKSLKQSVRYLIATKQWIKWDNLIVVLLYLLILIGINEYNPYWTPMIVAFTIPIIAMYLTKEGNVFKIPLAYFISLISILSIAATLIFLPSNIFTIAIPLLGSNLLFAYFEIPYKIYQWVHPKKFINVSIIVVIVAIFGIRLIMGQQPVLSFFIIVCIALMAFLLSIVEQWRDYLTSRRMLEHASKEELHEFLAEKAYFVEEETDLHCYDFDGKVISDRLESDIIRALKKHRLRCYNRRNHETQQLTLIIHEPTLRTK